MIVAFMTRHILLRSLKHSLALHPKNFTKGKMSFFLKSDCLFFTILNEVYLLACFIQKGMFIKSLIK